MRKLWGGAFESAAAQAVDRFGQSIDSDLTFWREDVLGSIAHARMLGACGVIAPEEADRLVEGLERILREGPDALPRDVEDVHTAVEARLGELVGPLAGKLHTARSRNDQVATDARLWLRGAIDGVLEAIKALQNALLEQATAHRRKVMRGWTHQQPAQPVTLGFHLAAHFWALQRDGWRFERVREAANLCPLGSAALAGTTFPIDREATARELGFAAPIPNALDATSDRSFVLDALHAAACTLLDLSRLCQELVLWSGAEFDLVRLGDEVTTGSSIMPQKRNPDMAELIRGRAARAIGHWTAVAAMLKGLPLGYNRDTQDDKPPLFDAMRLTRDALGLCRLMLESAQWNTAKMARDAGDRASTATDLADFLASRGVPFREAHERVGRLVRACEQRGWRLDRLNGARLRELDPDLPPEAAERLDARRAALRRESLGGPGEKAMVAQLRHMKRLLAKPGFPSLV
ncbi:MAG: argininosuccinate lyase [Fimbriimonadales bacterium]|nr:argininosuccinate lyase [Fimbriimonadales bacterium]